jgi:hypothetical protein
VVVLCTHTIKWGGVLTALLCLNQRGWESEWRDKLAHEVERAEQRHKAQLQDALTNAKYANTTMPLPPPSLCLPCVPFSSHPPFLSPPLTLCCSVSGSVEHSELVVELAGLRGQVATWQAQATQATHDATQAQHRADKLQQVHTASDPYTWNRAKWLGKETP